MIRTNVKYLIDFTLWTLATPLAFYIRVEAPFPLYTREIFLFTLFGAVVKAITIAFEGLHRQAWRKIGVPDLVRLSRAVVIVGLVMAAISFFMRPYFSIPRSIPIIDAMLALLALGGVRLASRLWDERSKIPSDEGKRRRVLVVGAGDAGTMLVREMLRHPEAGLIPVGFLDDDPGKRRKRYVGLNVLGGIPDLPSAVRHKKADEVLMAIPSAPGQVVRQVVELSQKAGACYRIIPGIYELLSGKVSISQIRNVDLEDLLRREPVRIDLKEIATYLKGRIVLVTGGGGSIGSEIVRQVTAFNPKQVLLLGRGENSLYTMEQEIRWDLPDLNYRLIVCDVRDRAHLEHIFKLYSPQVIFHAAAHKHVPLMEHNLSEAVLNNVLGTKNLVELALSYDIERFVNISTDKAVNPTSVMGATKRVAEYVVQWGAKRARPDQVFVSVRFGNVLGSRGSVIPLFKEQITRGGPVTVTHPDMQRYFMTIPEAAQLVLQAAGLGENGAVYVLDMGEPVKITDLATDLIRLSGLEPGIDIKITFTGKRPGEKLFEELLTAEEGVVASRHKKIFISRSKAPSDDEFNKGLKKLFLAAQNFDDDAIFQALKVLIPTYQPIRQDI